MSSCKKFHWGEYAHSRIVLILAGGHEWQAIGGCAAARNPPFAYCFELLSVGYAMLTHH
ncbi:hypothetical protein [Nitrosomonas sp. Is79A3]|uniref:hypothetical protein n=1 Tax=Nitrosomonas sp. (strain Is79A3) TaxID=261292 RepID=UPI0012EA3C9F